MQSCWKLTFTVAGSFKTMFTQIVLVCNRIGNACTAVLCNILKMQTSARF